MIFLDADATRAALGMGDAIEAMRRAFSDDGEAPLRVALGGSLFMPGRVGDLTAIKVVSTVPGNPVGIVVVFDASGSPIGMVDGPTLTAIRTGAVAGLATDLLAPPSASVLAMLGAGAMAFDQVEAVRVVRGADTVLVWSRDRSNAETLAGRVGGEVVEDPGEAVARADIVSCATPATSPLFGPDRVRPGTHINAVGAFTPEMAEVPPETVEGAFVVVDDYEAARAEAGDLIRVGRTPDASLRELIAGTAAAKNGDITFFKSVGIAQQDVAAAHQALTNASTMGLGVRL